MAKVNAPNPTRPTGTTVEDPLSILHIVAPAKFGGLESVLRGLAAGQTALGHSVRVALVLSPGSDRHPFAEALEADGVAFSRIEVRDRDYPGERRAVGDLIRLAAPDVVHTHGYRPDVVDGSLARARGIPVVSTCHGFIDSDLRGRVYQWLQRRALRQFDAVVAVSEEIAQRVRRAGVAADRVHVVPNVLSASGTVLTKAAARRQLDLGAAPVIGWVGRLSAEKGADIALDAVARMRRSNARLAVIGGGPDERALREQAVKLGLVERVLWKGAVSDAGRLFPAFDAFLLSSRTEGTPMALLEAISAQVPVVATRVGGVPDTVDDTSAALVDSGDVAAMARALDEIFDKPNVARARAEKARSRLEEQSNTGKWLARYETIYRSVLRTRAGVRGAEIQ